MHGSDEVDKRNEAHVGGIQQIPSVGDVCSSQGGSDNGREAICKREPRGQDIRQEVQTLENLGKRIDVEIDILSKHRYMSMYASTRHMVDELLQDRSRIVSLLREIRAHLP